MFIANYSYLENILRWVGRRCQGTAVLFSLAPWHSGIDLYARKLVNKKECLLSVNQRSAGDGRHSLAKASYL
jgi:hypothetical protein